MATKTLEHLRIVGGPHKLMEYPEAASQTFVKGALVYVDAANGQVTACADNAQVILGLAAEDAHNGSAGANNILVDVIYPGTELQGNIYHGTPASAVCVDASAGDLAEVVVVSGKTHVDISATAAAAFRILKRVKDDTATDVYARCRFSVISTYLQSDTATVS